MHKDANGTPLEEIHVEAATGQVRIVRHQGRRMKTGPGELAEAEAKRIASEYLAAHWPFAAEATFYAALQHPPKDPDRTSRYPPTQWWFRWYVERKGIRVGEAWVVINLTTGEVVEFLQHHWPAEGLPPPEISREKAIEETMSRLSDQQRDQARLKEAFLGTWWYKGKVRLQWVVWVDAPVGGPGSPPQIQGMQLDAHTGEPYNVVIGTK
jgi:hypothetical protein